MIIDLQRRIAECGRIRIGQQVATGNGKSRPAKLDTFRLTSADRHRIQAAAHLYGGTAREWQAPAGPQWEVITQTDALDVIVPPSDMAFSQHYELWSAGGCQRRCDGRTESISDGQCVCDPANRECDIHTRLSVMLRDLPGLGVWRIDTQGYYAAVELQGAVEVVQMAAGRGQMLPARLRLEQRVIKRPGTGTRRFAVPVLDIEVAPGQLLGGSPAPAALGHGDRRQIEDGQRQIEPAPLTPVPESVPEAPARSVAEQSAPPKAKPKRRNAAQPVPSTGLAPRTAAQAAAGEVPPPPEPPEAEQHDTEPMITREQSSKLHATFTEAGYAGTGSRADRLRVASGIVGRELDSSNDLTRREASVLIDTLDMLAQRGDLSGDADKLLQAVATARQEREAFEEYETERANAEDGEQ